MPQFDLNPERNEEEPAYIPASFEKRAAAWMGLAYMVMLVLIITYTIATGGQPLSGTFPLLLVPAAVAGLVVAIHRRKAGAGLAATILIAACCVCALILGLMLGVPALVSALQNPFGI